MQKILNFFKSSDNPEKFSRTAKGILAFAVSVGAFAMFFNAGADSIADEIIFQIKSLLFQLGELATLLGTIGGTLMGIYGLWRKLVNLKK